MDWMYPYAVPHGLVFRLEKEPLDTLPPQSVAQDFQFWNDYVEGLLSDPNYHEDFDAQRSFAKLRNSTGNLYRSREMWSEAEKAYRQALQLQPNNSESLAALNKILQKQKRWGEMVAIWDRALLDDPRNRSLQLSRQRVTQLRQGAREIEKLQEVLDSDPEDSMALSHLMRLLLETDQVEEANRQLEVSGQVFGDDLDYLQFATEFCNLHGLWEAGLGPARKWTAVAPDQATAWLVLARMEFANRDTDAFFEAAAQAVELGGGKARTALAGDAIYSTLQSDSKFQALLAP
jgi:tetratricopeptide (TPR) repeat protein